MCMLIFMYIHQTTVLLLVKSSPQTFAFISKFLFWILTTYHENCSHVSTKVCLCLVSNGWFKISYISADWPALPRRQCDCHHHTKVKPEAATAVIELLMMGWKTPETCWSVNKSQDNKLENCCIWLVIYLNSSNNNRKYKIKIPFLWNELLLQDKWILTSEGNAVS